MKLSLLNTISGLKPLYDEDYDEKKKLKVGSTYIAEIKLVRNPDFHRKYFALLICAWEFQSEAVREKYFKENIDSFRKTIQISAGYSETVYSVEKKEFIEIPKSISFEKMDEAEFQELYERVKDVLYKTFLKNISQEEFERSLMGF